MGRVMELLDARSTWRWVAADDRLWAPKVPPPSLSLITACTAPVRRIACEGHSIPPHERLIEQWLLSCLLLGSSIPYSGVVLIRSFYRILIY
uniref:Uncharacterized protein n=1 Tax=Oryza sativa subsp. japonica TaxID=39947 RepID=Q6Z9P1_ORYSJ|nr:unknown protein [Oryza sativa Japonica Group]